ncbi:MAG: hypothetical protein L3J74_14900, partial [Bacteroidales bacterium]|nr:hypothetical protein [Bacteroidales bacterium]
NISCWTSPRDFNQADENALKEKIEQSESLLLVIDKNSNKDKIANQALEYALENDLEIIPYVVDKIEEGLYADYFFYAFSWVDAYEDSFDEAYEVLLESFQEGEKAPKKAKSQGRKANAQNNVNTKQILIIALIVVAAIAGWFIYNNSTPDSSYDTMLVGKWKLNDYADNLKRTPQDSITFFTQTLPTLKKTVLLTFNEDHTFERLGFTPEPQIGKWKLNETGSVLELEPVGVQQVQKLNLQNFTEHSFTIVVTEQLEGGAVSTTRLTFVK